MKKLTILLGFLAILAFEKARGQANPILNMNSVPISIPADGFGNINVSVCNSGATTVAANKIRVEVSVPPAHIKITGATTTTGQPLSNFTIQTLSDDFIRILLTDPLPGGSCINFYITVAGISQSTTSIGEPFTGNFGYVGPPPSGNNPGDDGGNTPVVVTDPLPVKLVSFTANKEGGLTNLNWATTEEVNSEYFEIQRSENAKSWAKIGKVESNGESNTLQKYKFTDIEPLRGINYYRLKMVDKDATYAYSSIKSVDFNAAGQSVSLYPNPVSNTLFLKDEADVLLEAKDVKEVSIISSGGQTVYKSVSVSSQGIDVKNLNNGMYLVMVTRKDGVISTHKIVISK